MISQIDEQQTAMIARPVYPARQTRPLADVGSAQFAAILSAVWVHGGSFGGRLWKACDMKSSETLAGKVPESATPGARKAPLRAEDIILQ